MIEKLLPEKKRADEALKELGLADSREKAKRMIMAGMVMALLPRAKIFERVAKPGQILPGGTVVSVKERERFVSRGGYKLLTAIEHFNLDVFGKICLDAGASTGGFTDCLLQYGAERVYAVDVGTGQLDVSLRLDDRVVCLENVNLRHAGEDLLPEAVDVVEGIRWVGSEMETGRTVSMEQTAEGGRTMAEVAESFITDDGERSLERHP